MFETYRMLGRDREVELAREARRRRLAVEVRRSARARRRLTVPKHLENVYAKLGVNTRTAAVASFLGLVDDDR